MYIAIEEVWYLEKCGEKLGIEKSMKEFEKMIRYLRESNSETKNEIQKRYGYIK